MEDTVAVMSGVGSLQPEKGGVAEHFHFFGVFDGHGGALVSAHCKRRLALNLATELSTLPGAAPAAPGLPPRWGGDSARSVEEACVRAFSRTDEEVDDDARLQGSTAVVALASEARLCVANTGDSRAVLYRGGKAIPLSNDHKPDDPQEQERIERAGGHVLQWNGCRLMGVLAMSRAIGDHYLRPYIISTPQVMCTGRCPSDDFVVLASDGLWDVLSSTAACEMVVAVLRKCADLGRKKGLAAAAKCLTRQAITHGSTDNVSVVIIDMKENFGAEHSSSVPGTLTETPTGTPRGMGPLAP